MDVVGNMNRPRIHPAEEARHREAMDGLGVYDASWALAKQVGRSDLLPEQRRMLLFEKTVRGGPIPELFPELAELGHARIPVTLLDAGGVEEAAHIRYLPSSGTYRIIGSGWLRFAEESGISAGHRIDLYTCRRDDGGDGERCLFFFRS
ncbi:hypothetical protein ACQ4PT_013400 [Festuca glaucescens]